MKQTRLIRLPLLLFSVIILFGDCKQNPMSPITPPNNYSPFAGKFHGSWLKSEVPSDSLKISFDSTSMRFVDQAGYYFGIRREFVGTFVVDNATLILAYDYGSTSRFWYRFDNHAFVVGDSLFHYSWRYQRIGTTPSNNGWSIKPSIISEQTYFPIGYIMASCYSDSGAIVLETSYGDNQRYLIRFNAERGTSNFQLSSGTDAIDAVGSFLWLATDSTVEKRALRDSTILLSFSLRNVIGQNFHITGIAVGSNCWYVVAVSSLDNPGILLKYNFSGDLLSSTQTSTVIKDLCLVNDRLFCVDGDETFLELNPSTGYVIANYNLIGRPFGNNIDGIAFDGSTIQLAGEDSVGRLRISKIAIPSN